MTVAALDHESASTENAPTIGHILTAGTPFTDWALDLCERGLAVLPTSGDYGKTPRVRGFGKYRNPPRPEQIAKWIAQFPDANIGVLTGLSRVVIVDIDDPSLLAAMLERFGETPLISQTPRPGFQLWYRDHRQERATLPSKLPGMAVDIKSGTGIVIVPPSFNPERGRHYEFYRGGWDDLSSLPPFPIDKLGTASTSVARKNERRSAGSLSSYPSGCRNNALLREALMLAPWYDDADDLAPDLMQVNLAKCDPTMALAEVRKIADSAMRYQKTGRNFFETPGCVVPYHALDWLARHAAAIP